VEPVIRILPAMAELCGAFAREFRHHAKTSILRHGIFTVALAGGSTPRMLYEHLASDADLRPMWKNIHVFWGDERCVGPDDKESNFRMARETLLSYVEIPEGNIHRIRGEENPESEVLRYDRELRRVLGLDADHFPQIDMIHLGMGSDGHTASLFPGDEGLADDLRACRTAVHPATGQERISFTLRMINNARHIAVVVTGREKAAVVATVLGDPAPERLMYPAAHVRPKKGTLTWFLDAEASSAIQT
jgi:6-phosphogluconolactonase